MRSEDTTHTNWKSAIPLYPVTLPSRDSLYSPLNWAGKKISNSMLGDNPVLPWRQFLFPAPSDLPGSCPLLQQPNDPLLLKLLLFSRLIASKALHSHVPPTPESWQHTSLHHPGLHVGGMRSEIKYCILYFRSLGRLHFCLLQLQMVVFMENK